jgi:hypothetical protein
MRRIFLILFALSSVFSYSQEKENRKGEFIILWGWNRAWYSDSDIHFSGPDYDFTLHNVKARDRQTKFDPGIYFHPKWITLPQTNFKIGYFITNNYEISIAVDHMKYIVNQNQKVKINGDINIAEDTIYNGLYNNNEMEIEYDFIKKEGFLAFEHTDGLNYIHLEYRRFDNLLTFNQFGINLTEGIGVGVLFPRTNSSLLGHDRYDQFNVAGYGINSVIGINLNFQRWFIQSELKGGFINMPNIRTTNNSSDKASQHFSYVQANFLVGVRFRLK